MRRDDAGWIWRIAFNALLVVALLLAMVSLARSQARACAPHDDIVGRLDKSFQEKQRAFGLIGGRAIVELYISAKGSWTIIVTGTDGRTCILAAGEGWENIPQIEGSPI